MSDAVSEWLKIANESNVPWALAIDTVVELTLLGAPGGDQISMWRLSDGTLSAADGQAPKVAVTVGWSDACAMVIGEVVPAVAYMQGKLKPSGNMEDVLLLLERTCTENFKLWIRALSP